MASLFYGEDRDEDFLQACESVRKENRSISISEITAKAILKQAKSFYIQPKAYIQIIRNNGNKLPKNEISKVLHIDILKRAKEIMAQNKDYTPAQVAKVLAEQKAPRFYISEARAESLYYKLLK